VSADPVDLVIDASVGTKWFVPEILSEQASLLLGDGFRCHVPVLFYTEVVQAIWKKVRLRQELKDEDGRIICKRLLIMSLEIHPTNPVLELAFDLALETGRTVYDCVYVATAQTMACRLVTADRRLYNAFQGTPLASSLIWVADIPVQFASRCDPGTGDHE